MNIRNCNNLTGKKYGKLTVVKYSHKENNKYMCWECKCDCGNTIIERGAFLKSGAVTSCGCKDKTIEVLRIEVGHKVRFDPFEEMSGFTTEDIKGNFVIGRVVYVNRPHNWFSVEYGEPKMRTSFLFSQIGNEVKVCGRR